MTKKNNIHALYRCYHCIEVLTDFHYLCACAGILDLADSYCETDLKNKCERLICQRVTVDNVITLFAVAHKYRTQVLKYGFPRLIIVIFFHREFFGQTVCSL